MSAMLVGFVGSRDYSALDRVRAHVAALAVKYPDAIVVSGGCKGVDSVAELAARRAGLGVISFRPREASAAPGRWWIHETRSDGTKFFHSCPHTVKTFGAAAFYRNGLIAKYSRDAVMAYPSSPGRGTRDTIRKAQALGRRVFVYEEA